MKPRVLLVDDSDMVRELVIQLVEGDFQRIDQARDGKEALALLRSRMSGLGMMPSVIVSDLDMAPGMCGDDFAREIAKDPNLWGIPFLLSSADPEVRKVAAALGVQAFEKSASLAGIREAILNLTGPHGGARFAQAERQLGMLQAEVERLTNELAESKRVEDRACRGLEERCMLVVTAVEKASRCEPLTFHDAVAEIARLGQDREEAWVVRAQRDEQAKALGVLDGLLRAIVVYAKKPSEAHATAVEARGIIAALAALHPALVASGATVFAPDLVTDPTAAQRRKKSSSGSD